MSALCVLAMTIALSGQAAAKGRGRAPEPGVFPIDSSPLGNSYGDWSAAWWQWAFALPVEGHPLVDETGAQCGAGQAGNVWFLGGVFNESGTAVRTECTIPAGKALFFPILNVECSNAEGDGDSYTSLGACTEFFMGGATGLKLSIDGVQVEDLLDRFRVKSGTFGFTLPADNLLGAPAGTCFSDGDGSCEPYLSVSEGVYVMLAPLSPGAHTIRLRGSFVFPDLGFEFSLDVTYELTVAA
ncbi:MAG: hypothetical protein ACE5JH_11640 [Acidobacteriota bacterium]